MLEYGITGIMQPLLDYNIGYCDYNNCNICTQMCTTGATKMISYKICALTVAHTKKLALYLHPKKAITVTLKEIHSKITHNRNKGTKTEKTEQDFAF